MQDSYGIEIKEGDTLRCVVGIPGRDVDVLVKKDRRGRWLAVNAEGSLSLSQVLKLYDCAVLTEPK
jgi:hypothetical protein